MADAHRFVLTTPVIAWPPDHNMGVGPSDIVAACGDRPAIAAYDPLTDDPPPKSKMVYIRLPGPAGHRSRYDEPSIDKIAERWVRRIGQARRQSKHVAHYEEIRYEQLILETEPTLRDVCAFLELRWDESILDYPRRSAPRLEEMRRELPADPH